jgi:hypothetical protein
MEFSKRAHGCLAIATEFMIKQSVDKVTDNSDFFKTGWLTNGIVSNLGPHNIPKQQYGVLQFRFAYAMPFCDFRLWSTQLVLASSSIIK